MVINGDGNHTRDYIYAEDIADAIYRSLKLKNKFNVFHISTGVQTSILELLKIIKRSISRHNFNLPNVRHTKNRMGDMRFNSMSPTRKKNNLKWKKINTLNTGMSKTVSWFINSQ